VISIAGFFIGLTIIGFIGSSGFLTKNAQTVSERLKYV
jgi:hypothetical protein